MKKQQLKSRPLVFSKLTQRLLTINIVVLAIIGGGVLLLDQNRRGLTQDRLKTLQSEVQSIAVILSLERKQTQTISLAEIEELREVYGDPANRLRYYYPQNNLIVDTTPTSAAPAIAISELPPTGSQDSAHYHDNSDRPSTDQLLEKLSQLIDGGLASLHTSVFNKQTGTSAQPLKGQCGPERPLSKDRDGNTVLNTSVQVLGWMSVVENLPYNGPLVHPPLGCLLLTANISDIDQQVQKGRMELVMLSAIALSITLLLSLYLARSVAHPVRQLAASAENVTREPTRAHKIPDLSNRHDEIGDLSVALRQMGDSLSERINAIERFAGDVAHELKNPLASLSSTNELLNKYSSDKNFRQHVVRQADDIRRMDRLITDIMNDARLDSELASALTEKIELKAILQTLVDVYTETGMTSTTQLAFKNEDTQEYIIYGDEHQVARVVQNLIDNSIAFSPSNGLILVALSSQKGLAQIMIEDDGPGILKQNLEKIFEPFVTDSPQNQKFGNHSGLGLSIARKIIRRHGGVIWAENRENSERQITGSRFIVRLPLAP
jgi:two-component system sensor histidine kinase ChvG